MDINCFHYVIFEDDTLNLKLLQMLTAIEVEALVECLKAEADRHWSINPNISANLARKIQQIGTSLSSKRYLALGKMAEGDATKLLGSAKDAWQLLGEAGVIYRQISDDVGWARTRIGRIFISPEVDTIDEAMNDAAIARRILIGDKQYERCVYLDMNIATVYHKIGDTDAAIQYYGNAMTMALSMKDAGEHLLWPIQYNLALTFTETGQFKQATQAFEYAVDIAIKQKQTRNIVYALIAFGELKQIQGKYREALGLILQAEDYVKKQQEQSKVDYFFVLRVKADCFLQLNRYLEAHRMAQMLVAGFLEHDMDYEAARGMYQLAFAQIGLSDFDGALKSLNRAITILDKLGNTIWIARHLRLRAQILIKIGNTHEAQWWLQRALSTSEPESINYARCLLLQAEVLYEDNDYEQANDIVRDGLKLIQRLASYNLRYKAYVLLGKLAEVEGRVLRARRYYHAALTSLERSQRYLTIRTRHQFMEDKSAAFHNLMRLYLQSENYTEAFELLERVKSLVLNAYLTNREALKWKTTDIRSAELLTELEEIRSEHHILYQLVYHDLDEHLFQQFARRYENPSQELQLCERRMSDIVDRLFVLHESSTLNKDTTIPSMKDIQGCLSNEEVIVQFYSDGATLWAFTLGYKSLDVVQLPIQMQQMENLLSKLQANLDWALNNLADMRLTRNLSKQFNQISEQLYRSIWQPIAQQITNNTRLIIVPFASLHYLPFNTLFDGNHYLIENFEVSSLPASSLIFRKPKARDGVRILAHSWQGKLPYVSEEAKQIQTLTQGQMYLENEAQRAILSSQPFKILHIAAHGEYRMDVPELSHMELGDGQLYMDDLLQEDLSYELIILSGCETGRASISSNDELIGLGSGFIYAGAGAVLASIWQVNDAITPKFMAHFYRELYRGLSKSAALREAQKNLITDTSELHPAFWGAFQLIGNPETLFPNMYEHLGEQHEYPNQ